MVVHNFKDTGSPGCWAWLTRKGTQSSFRAFKHPPRYCQHLVGWRTKQVLWSEEGPNAPLQSQCGQRSLPTTTGSAYSCWIVCAVVMAAWKYAWPSWGPISTEHCLSSGSIHPPRRRRTDRSSFLGLVIAPMQPDRAVHGAGRLSTSLGYWSLIWRKANLHAPMRACAHCSPATSWMKSVAPGEHSTVSCPG